MLAKHAVPLQIMLHSIQCLLNRLQEFVKYENNFLNKIYKKLSVKNNLTIHCFFPDAELLRTHVS